MDVERAGAGHHDEAKSLLVERVLDEALVNGLVLRGVPQLALRADHFVERGRCAECTDFPNEGGDLGERVDGRG